MAANNVGQGERNMPLPNVNFVPIWFEDNEGNLLVNEQARIYYVVYYKIVLSYTRFISYNKRKLLEYLVLLMVNFHMISKCCISMVLK